METSVVSKIGTPRIRTGTSHVAGTARLGTYFQAERGHQETEQHGAAIAHKNFRGIEIPAQKAERGAQYGGGRECGPWSVRCASAKW